VKQLSKKHVPMPGDIVVATKTDDTLIAVGAKGIIEGVAGHARKEYHVLFNWSPLPWWDKGVVDSSGGPERIIRASNLKYKERTKQDFHYFPHGAGADLAEVKTHSVSVWEVDLTPQRCRYCGNMKPYGDEGSMKCEKGLSKTDKDAKTCPEYFPFK
jgi:hypothetical protein